MAFLVLVTSPARVCGLPRKRETVSIADGGCAEGEHSRLVNEGRDDRPVLLRPFGNLGLAIFEQIRRPHVEGETSCEWTKARRELSAVTCSDRERSPPIPLLASHSLRGFSFLTNLPFLSSTRGDSPLAEEMGFLLLLATAFSSLLFLETDLAPGVEVDALAFLDLLSASSTG